MKSLTLDVKSLIVPIVILALFGMAAGVVVTQGATEASVGATVTVQNISVVVSDGTVEYGILVAGSSQDTVVLSDPQTATNSGNVTATLNIRGTDSTAWFLKATAAGATDYKHEFSKDAFAAGTALTLNNQTLAAGVIAGNSQVFDLRITTPPSASDFSQQSVDVTIQATI